MPSYRKPTLIVLYDHACPLCRTELLALKARDLEDRIKLIDIRAAQFRPAAWGFAMDALETTLHVRDTAGLWHTGMDAIRLVFATTHGSTPLARLLKRTDLPGVRGLADRLYLHLAKHRFGVSAVLARYFGYRVANIGAMLGPCSNDSCMVGEHAPDEPPVLSP
jgi:predicted DCC family thiol-disulfide oxidoreductase YuxK